MGNISNPYTAYSMYLWAHEAQTEKRKLEIERGVCEGYDGDNDDDENKTYIYMVIHKAKIHNSTRDYYAKTI